MTPYLYFHFMYPRIYPAADADRVLALIQDAIAEWGRRTYREISAFFDKHPGEKTAVKLEGFRLDYQIKGADVWGLVVLKRYRGEALPEFVCQIGPEKSMLAERARILKEARMCNPKARVTIVEQDL
jgi:hypothetical protein